ncbi:MAG: FtsQ-type POTRA domain-containing protein [Oscillospiraceae bacterium]|nr:FtsQ-type POTRA domain-containing protein [Oscillospiraceae bacterium]
MKHKKYNNKNNKKSKKPRGSKIKKFMLTLFVFSAAITAFFIFANQYFFRIENIITGENDRYSGEEILAASGIKPGGELYGINIKQVKQNIKEILTYTESVAITRIPPSTVKINIETAGGLFGIMTAGDYYIASDNLRIVEKIKIESDNFGFTPPEDIITLEIDTDDIKKCYLGEKLEFTDGDIQDFLTEFAGFLAENKTGGEYSEQMSAINGVNIKDKFGVTVNYGGRFLIRLGIFENIPPKIINSFEIIKRLSGGEEGIIDMTDKDGKTASFIHRDNIEALYKSG